MATQSAREQSAWGGRLFLDAGTILFVGPGGKADRHAHHAVQLVRALDGEIAITVKAPLRRRAALIPAGATHAFDATGLRVAIMFVEPHGTRGAALDQRARQDLGGEVVERLAGIPFPRLDLTNEDATDWCDATLAALGVVEPTTALSSVSRRAIDYIEGAIDGTPQLAEAACRIGISPIVAGFSDSAHLSRTFRAMFGLRPSLVLPLAEIVPPRR